MRTFKFYFILHLVVGLLKKCAVDKEKVINWNEWSLGLSEDLSSLDKLLLIIFNVLISEIFYSLLFRPQFIFEYLKFYFVFSHFVPFILEFLLQLFQVLVQALFVRFEEPDFLAVDLILLPLFFNQLSMPVKLLFLDAVSV